MTTFKRAAIVMLAALALGVLSATVQAQITQDTGATYVAFEAEGATLIAGTPENWEVTPDATASAGSALIANGTTSTASSPQSFAQFQINFKTAGTYYLYYRWRADAARTAAEGTGSANSSWVGNRFGAFSTPGASAQVDYVRTDSNNYSSPADNSFNWLREVATLTYPVGAAEIASVQTLTLGTRECGMIFDRIVLSTDSTLTAAALDALRNSGYATTPSFSPAPGRYEQASMNITITADPGSTIYYTTDGTTPTSASPSGASPVTVNISGSPTVRAYATVTGSKDSLVGSASYVMAGALNSIQLVVPSTMFYRDIVTPQVLASFAALPSPIDITKEAGVTFSSSNTNAVTYGSDGNFHAVATGTSTLQAAFEGKTSPVSVTVVIEPVVLKHRYSFDGAAGTTVITDSVGGASGTLINGSDAAKLGGGKLVLDGNFSSAYVELPAGIISKLTNATFKSWVTWDGGNAWQRIWDFGTNSAPGADVSAAYLSPFGGDFGALLFGFNMAGEQRVNASSRLVTGTEVCVTVSFSYSGQVTAIYVGGRKVASGTVTKAFSNLPDVYNWLGKAKYNDPYYSGSFDEFRIYAGAETDLAAAVSAAAGPDSTMTDPGALVSLAVTAAQSTFEAQSIGTPLLVLANFANITNVDVTTMAETTISSSDPLVAAVVNGNIVPMGVGKTVISASYGGQSGTLTVTVTDSSPWPTLLHRYTFSDPQGTTIADSVGTINATFHGVGTFTGSQVIMPANNPAPLADGNPNPNAGWISFPAGQGILTGLPSQASIETWVVWNGGGIWQEIWDFGQAGTPGLSLGGGKYVMICPYDGITGALRAEWWPGGLVLTGPRVPVGVLSQIVLTHDQDRQVDKLYLNGQLVASGVNTWLWTDLPDADNWMARDQWQDLFFNGAYDDMRIWSGALTAGQVANAYKAGANRIVGPDLKISSSGSQITLKWAANATGFTLQSTSNLTSGTWGSVSGTPVVIDGLNTLTVTPGPEPAFYRLKQ